MSEKITFTCFRCKHEHHLPYDCNACGSGQIRLVDDINNKGVYCGECRIGWNRYTCKNCKIPFALTPKNVTDPKNSISFGCWFLMFLFVVLLSFIWSQTQQ